MLDASGKGVELSSCRICGGTELDSILSLGVQALTGVFPKSRDEHIDAGPLELVKCRESAGSEACGLVQLRHSYDSEAMYGMNYGYRSGLNRSMVDHLKGLAAQVKQRVTLASGDLVLDIGSNDSTLLQALDTEGVTMVGMDPTGVKFNQYYPAHIRLIPDFFSAQRFVQEFGSRKAKIVTSIAMFYDLDAPLEFMRQVAAILHDEGVWIFEQSYLPTMLEMNAYDTVCHEHLEYYGLKQIAWMTKRAGLRIVDVELNKSNGGSFRVTVGLSGSFHQSNSAVVERLLKEEQEQGLGGLDLYSRFRERVFRHRDEMRALIDASVAKGETIIGYGASTKGNVLLQFCGITPVQIPYIAEVNPEKFGCFTPQTLIPIIPEAEARAMKPDGLLVLPWHFRENITAREQGYLASGGKLIFPLPIIEVTKLAASTHSRV